MKQEFEDFNKNIKLTADQKKDAKKKYTGVCTKLYSKYYEGDYDEKKKYLFGSYKTHTNVRPISDDHDVDVIFKLPAETISRFQDHSGNGPSNLLQEIKNCLNEKYTTTDKISAWGKVVLVNFSDNHHNVEILPASENDDGTFTIPNSENGGSWENFNPRNQIDKFQESNTQTNNLTADLARMIKTWRNNTSSMNYKSYKLIEDVIEFLDKKYISGAGYENYSNVLKDFLLFLKDRCDSNITSYVQSAIDRSVKAIAFYVEDQPHEASIEWRKIFGKDNNSLFPLVKENPKSDKTPIEIKNPAAPYA